MKAIVRDDIIALDSFVAAEFKYKQYLEMLMKAGNYCFMDQFKKFIPSGQAIINGMIEHNLIGTENVNNNYKYIYLSDTAMKYLYLKDSEEDFSQVKKNRISVKKVNKNPSEKQLLSSAYKFHLLANGEELIDKESIMKELRDYILTKKHKGNYNNYLNWSKNEETIISELKEKIKELIEEEKSFTNTLRKLDENQTLIDTRIELKEIQELKQRRDKVQKEVDVKSSAIVKLGLKELNEELNNVNLLINELEKRLYIKKSTIDNYRKHMKKLKEKREAEEAKLTKKQDKYNPLKEEIDKLTLPQIEEIQREFEKLYDISKIITRIKDSNLEFIILDTGNFKTAYGYLKQINALKELDLRQEGINIIIYSYAENRARNLYNEFIKAKEAKRKALETMRSYNIATKNSEKKADFYLAAESTYKNTPEFNVEVKEDCFYIKSYKELLSSTTKSIKRKDKKAIDDLINKLKDNHTNSSNSGTEF